MSRRGTDGEAAGRRPRASTALLLSVVLPLLFVPAQARGEDVVEVTLSKSGVKPDPIRLRKGEPAHLDLKSADEEHCFAVDALRLEKRVQPGRTTQLEFTPDKAGSFTVYCCLEPDNAAVRGRLVVVE